ncbi:hypothetical protein GIB67_007591 [Kingdonia uniflora]|uniref:Glucan endo-1,3-beta-D-glucosidase n=1 Tax=Kingdonia uniflora TaxID=39325 RepID=A0A7J7N1P4_9MAGN|nr:hypothetical protein GIB67_007591 [Kingdonia uniflora]
MSPFFIFFFLSLPIVSLSKTTNPITPISSKPPTPPIVGITITNHTITNTLIISTLQTLKITHVRLPDSNPDTIRAFSYTNISLLLSIPNSFIPEISSNRSKALKWLNTHVIPFYPRVRITVISVGNDILDYNNNLSVLLLPAINNVHQGLGELGIHNKILVSTTFSFINVISPMFFPPSSATFQVIITETLIKPLLKFLARTNSSFLVNVYPYHIYWSHSEIPIGYALFQENSFNFRDDLMTGVRYRNLFDTMVDGVVTAMGALGYEDIPLIVTETGWPSQGGEREIDATKIYAEMYLKGLVRHLRSGLGTPLRRDGVAETYVFELLDEEGTQKGVESKKHWGVLYQNLSRKYDFDFSSAAGKHDECERCVIFLVLLILLTILLIWFW